MLSRIDLQGLPVTRQPCNLNDLVSDLVEEFSALAIASQICLDAVVPATTSITVLGSEEQLYRLVANLITNALQYTPAGGSVTVHLSRDEQTAWIQVQDTGIGIALMDQARIFDRFYRVSSDRSRHTGGAGLGLSIAQAIAQAHRGHLQVKSQLGQGSTFSLSLPIGN